MVGCIRIKSESSSCLLVHFFFHEVLLFKVQTATQTKQVKNCTRVEKSFCERTRPEPLLCVTFAQHQKRSSKEGGDFLCLSPFSLQQKLASLPIFTSPFMTPIHHLWQQLFLIFTHNWLQRSPTFATQALQNLTMTETL